MTELSTFDFSAPGLAATADRLAAHHQVLQRRIDDLVDETQRCRNEVKQTGDLMDAVARMRDAQDKLLERIGADQAVFSLIVSSSIVQPPAVDLLPADEPSTDQPSDAEEPDTGEVAEEPAPSERAETLPVKPEPAPARRGLSAGQQRVLDVLVANAKPDGWCAMAAADVAEAARVSVGTLRVQVMPKLKGLGLAETRRHQGVWSYYVHSVASTAEAAPPPAAESGDVEGTGSERDDATGSPASAPAPVAPVKADSRMIEDRARVMQLLRRAPPENDGSAMFMMSVVAKRMEMTELRLDQVLDHLGQIGAIERRSCGLKDHFRVAVGTDGEGLV